MRTKGLWAWIVICLWLLGCIGGVGYTIWVKAYVIAAGVAANGVLAFFKVREFYKDSFTEK